MKILLLYLLSFEFKILLVQLQEAYIITIKKVFLVTILLVNELLLLL